MNLLDQFYTTDHVAKQCLSTLSKHINMDEDFFNGKHKIAMEKGQRAKYNSDIYSQKILLLTKDAKLTHLMKQRGQNSKMITFYDSMKIRKELNNK